MSHFPLIPEIVYSPRRNPEPCFRAAYFAGGRGSGFGEEQNGYRVEFHVRYFFQLP